MLKEHPEIHLRPEVKYSFRCVDFRKTGYRSKLFSATSSNFI